MYETKPYDRQLKFRCVARYYFDDRYRYQREQRSLQVLGLSPDEIYDELGAPPMKRPAPDEIAASITYTFQDRSKGDYSSGRFNTDEFPALYTAGDSATAFGERHYHWVKDLSVSNPDAGFVIYTVRFTGQLRDIRAAIAAEALPFPDADYFSCQAVGEAALDDGLDGVVAPSKRVSSGSCCAVFRKGAVEPVDVVEVGTFSK